MTTRTAAEQQRYFASAPADDDLDDLRDLLRLCARQTKDYFSAQDLTPQLYDKPRDVLENWGYKVLVDGKLKRMTLRGWLNNSGFGLYALTRAGRALVEEPMTGWRAKLESSREIVQRAIATHEPYAVVAMVSGGDDSLTAYHVARYLNVKLDAVLHVVTGTGIPETTAFVREFGEAAPERYLEANAGSAYEDYVTRKGFFGRGMLAHAYAYHLLKADGFRKLLSQHIRQGARGRKILLINGARQSESDNRMFTMREPIQIEKQGSSNFWVNIINDWDKPDCRAFLNELGCARNPVTKNLCRSGECLCGTMQSQDERREAAFFYPQWGAWLDDLEQRVVAKHGWGWGDAVPQWFQQQKDGQLPLFDFMPMCTSCNERNALVEERMPPRTPDEIAQAINADEAARQEATSDPTPPTDAPRLKGARSWDVYWAHRKRLAREATQRLLNSRTPPEKQACIVASLKPDEEELAHREIRKTANELGLKELADEPTLLGAVRMSMTLLKQRTWQVAEFQQRTAQSGAD